MTVLTGQEKWVYQWGGAYIVGCDPVGTGAELKVQRGGFGGRPSQGDCIFLEASFLRGGRGPKGVTCTTQLFSNAQLISAAQLYSEGVACTTQLFSNAQLISAAQLCSDSVACTT